MTTEQAIKILNGAIKKPNTIDGYLGQALTMAINALENRTELIRCKDCKSWGRLVTYKDGSTMIDCKRGRSIDPEGYCHLAELRGDADVPESIT